MRIGRFIFCLVGLFFVVGCVYQKITNLTPGALPRNASGFYRVEIIWESNQPTVRHETVKPQVMIGTNSFVMENTPLMTNRWDAKVPVDSVANELRYRIKVNWQYNAIPVPAANSQLSEEFLLRINN
jgi:hypothetical protein